MVRGEARASEGKGQNPVSAKTQDSPYKSALDISAGQALQFSGYRFSFAHDLERPVITG